MYCAFAISFVVEPTKPPPVELYARLYSCECAVHVIGGKAKLESPYFRDARYGQAYAGPQRLECHYGPVSRPQDFEETCHRYF